MYTNVESVLANTTVQKVLLTAVKYYKKNRWKLSNTSNDCNCENIFVDFHKTTVELQNR